MENNRYVDCRSDPLEPTYKHYVVSEERRAELADFMAYCTEVKAVNTHEFMNSFAASLGRMLKMMGVNNSVIYNSNDDMLMFFDKDHLTGNEGW